MAICEYRYTAFLEPAEEGGFVVTCPALPGLVTEGNSFEDARAMATDAIRGYLESLLKDGLPLAPDDSRPRSTLRRETVTVAVEGV